MSLYPAPLQDLIDSFAKLPGIGPKSAQRIAFHLLAVQPEASRQLAEAIVDARDKLRFCESCFNLSEDTICHFCSNPRRDPSLICVVEEPRDVVAMERTREFRGLYHVLGGSISPIANVGPDDIRLAELLKRVKEHNVREVIVATNPNIEGEATALYVSKVLRPLDVTVTRIASGLPVGGDLEYADELTLGRALEGRREI